MKANILVDEKIDVRLDPKGNIIYTRAGAPDTQAISQVVYDISDAN